MKKGKTQPPGPPDRAQMEALERQLQEGDTAEALRRLQRLVQRHPRHGGLRGLLVELLARGGNLPAAAAAAHDWTEASPGSVKAHRAALACYRQAGHPALADEAARRLRERGEPVEHEERFPAGFQEVLYGTAYGLADLLAFDLGRLFLNAGQYGRCADALAGQPYPPSRNNRAQALFHGGDAAAAAEVFSAACRDEPANLFALASAARLSLYLGRPDAAGEFLTRLAQAAPQRAEDAAAQLTGLVFGGLGEAGLAAFEAATRTSWYAELGPRQADFLFLAGLCCHRLGRAADAAARWGEALDRDPDHRPSRAALEDARRAAEEREGPALFNLFHWLPASRIQGLAELARRAPGAPPDGAATMHLFREASDGYLARVFGLSDAGDRGLCRTLLSLRALSGSPGAADALRSLLVDAQGTDAERRALLGQLRDLGVLAAGEVVEVRLRGEITRASARQFRVTLRARPSALPDAARSEADRALEAFRAGQAAQAEALFARLAGQFPGDPVVAYNLSAAQEALGKRAEAEASLRTAVALDPDYLMARCSLARRALLEGRPEEARSLVQGLEGREEYHVEEAFALLGTEAMLRKAAGGTEEEIAGAVADLEPFAATSEGWERLRQVRAALGRVRAATRG